jgi:hypothetical protein
MLFSIISYSCSYFLIIGRMYGQVDFCDFYQIKYLQAAPKASIGFQNKGIFCMTIFYFYDASSLIYSKNLQIACQY